MSTKRKQMNKQTNINFSPGASKIVKTSKVQPKLPELPQGVGMACTRPGYIRYLDELRKRLSNVRHEEKRINVKYLEYSESKNEGVVSNTSAQILSKRPILKFKNNGSNMSRLNASAGSIHYFLISITKRDNPNLGHAVNVLMDTGRPQPRILVFDPHGHRATERNGYGSIFRNRILPNMKKMFGSVFDNTAARYYTGPDLQANNTRGICTTFHLDFAEAIPALLNGTANIQTFSGLNLNVAGRIAFLNDPILTATVTAKSTTQKNTTTPPTLTMTMGSTSQRSKKGRKKGRKTLAGALAKLSL